MKTILPRLGIWTIVMCFWPGLILLWTCPFAEIHGHRWHLVGSELNGRHSRAAMHRNILQVSNESGTWNEPALPNQLVFSCSVDSTKTPKEIDLVLPWNPTKTLFGIYKIENHWLTICAGDVRPTEFTSNPPDGDRWLLTFNKGQWGPVH